MDVLQFCITAADTLALGPIESKRLCSSPKWIKDKHAVTNIVGTGDDCFKWAVPAGLHPVADHPHRMENYIDHASNYDFSTLTFPVPLSAVVPFAAKNKYIDQRIWYRRCAKGDIPIAGE